MRLLVTGFEPFAGEPVNPSWEAALGLRRSPPAGWEVAAERLPTVFRVSIDRVCALVAHHRPAAVICLGEAGGRGAISVERLAVNLDDASIPDNAGHRPVETPVEPGGPAAYFSTLPVGRIVARLRGAGIPAEVSATAGSFVCNHTFYGLMHWLGPQSPVRAGFIHVPYLPEQAARHPGRPSMAIETTVRAVALAAEATLEHIGEQSVRGPFA